MRQAATTPKSPRPSTRGGPRPGAGRPRKDRRSKGLRNAQARRENQERRDNGNDVPARGRLLEAADALLAESGYEALTVTGICSQAGLSAQTFYQHFADKRAIAVALEGEELAAIDAQLRAAIEARSPLAAPLAEALDRSLAERHPSATTPRARLIEAMVEIAATKGFEQATIPELGHVAGVSRGVFYRWFSDRVDCLAAAHSRLLAQIDERIAPARHADDPCARARATLAALAQHLAREPRAAWILLVEAGVLGSGERRLTDLLADELAQSFPDAPRTASRFAAGAVSALLRTELTTSGAQGIADLGPELAFAALGPLAGPERARAELERARAQDAPSKSARSGNTINGAHTTSPSPARKAGETPTSATRPRTGARAR